MSLPQQGLRCWRIVNAHTIAHVCVRYARINDVFGSLQSMKWRKHMRQFSKNWGLLR